jgi:UDP-GlcNAc:undecaprenyl-phosphate GlcNAc-1-phosphate transferase
MAFTRRLGSGRHVFHADREHIHHRLLALGLSPRGALFALWGLCAVFGLTAVVLAAQPRSVALLVVLLLALVLFIAFEILLAVGRRGREGER